MQVFDGRLFALESAWYLDPMSAPDPFLYDLCPSPWDGLELSASQQMEGTFCRCEREIPISAAVPTLLAGDGQDYVFTR